MHCVKVIYRMVVKYSLEHGNNDYRFFFVYRPSGGLLSVYDF